jgi:surface protein
MPIVKAYLGTTPLFTETPTASSDWVRPTDWLTLPLATANSVRGLYAVFNQTENYVTIRMQTNDGSTYTIDWGDGTVTTNAASNTLIIKNYDYNNVALNGTLSTRGYKQAIITVTPQAGKNFILCRIDEKPTTPSGIGGALSSGWLDININLPNLTTGQKLYIGSNISLIHRLLERVNITSWGAITSTNEMFRNTPSLASLNETEWNFANITSTANMFFTSGIRRLNCLYWDVSKNQSFANMFRDCPNLQSIKCSNWNTAASTSMGQLFMGCTALEDVDVTNWNLSNNTFLAYMFQSCRSLRNINVSNWNTSKVTAINNMFEGCTVLTDLITTNWTLPLCTNATGFINLCSNLRKVGPLNLSNVTTYTAAAFAGTCNSLTEANFTGIKASVLFTNGMLGATALNALYTGLATVVGQTITVTGNYGTATDDPTIATGKGWTVTG